MSDDKIDWYVAIPRLVVCVALYVGTAALMFRACDSADYQDCVDKHTPRECMEDMP